MIELISFQYLKCCYQSLEVIIYNYDCSGHEKTEKEQKNVCGKEIGMANSKTESNGWELVGMAMYVPLMLHRREQRGRLKMPSESHCHDSSQFLLGLLGSTNIVVVEGTEDNKTDDPQIGN